MKKLTFAWILSAVLFASASWATPVEILPNFDPRSGYSFGFRCEYPRSNWMDWILVIQTPQKIETSAPLYWNVYDTQSGKYLIKWKLYKAVPSENPSYTVIAIETKEEDEVHAVLPKLKTSEIHFTSVNVGNDREVAYLFPLGRYRELASAYFQDLTKPTFHCHVNEHDLPQD